MKIKNKMKLIAVLLSVVMALQIPFEALAQTVDSGESEVSASVAADADVMTKEAEELDVTNLTSADIVGELTELRDANTKHYRLVNGENVAVVYQEAVHEWVDGQWVDIDNSLETVSEPTDFASETSDTVSDGSDTLQRNSTNRTKAVRTEEKLTNKSNNFKVSFAKGENNDQLIDLKSGETGISWSLDGADKKDFQVEDNSNAIPSNKTDSPFAVKNNVSAGVYPDVLPGTDLEYVLQGASVKENIVIKDKTGINDYAFTIQCSNVTAVLNEDQSVTFVAADGSEVYTVAAPYMFDAKAVQCDDIQVELTPVEGGYSYKLVPNKDWMTSKERQFPIIVDPTVRSEQSTTAAHCSYVKESMPTTTFKSETSMRVGEASASANVPATQYGLAKINLPSLGSGNYVVGAYLSLTPVGDETGYSWQSSKVLYPNLYWNYSSTAGSVYINGVSLTRVGNIVDSTKSNYGLYRYNAYGTMTSATDESAPVSYKPVTTMTNSGYTSSFNCYSNGFSLRTLQVGETWTIAFWAKGELGSVSSAAVSMKFQSRGYTTNSTLDDIDISIPTDSEWHYYQYTFTVPVMSVASNKPYISTSVGNGATLRINNLQLTPGAYAPSDDTYTDDGKLKNITVDTGSYLYNTGIEYDVDSNRTELNRIKTYINDGEATRYGYDSLGNITDIYLPDGKEIHYQYDKLNQLTREDNETLAVSGSSVYGNGKTIVYAYDVRGNMTSKTSYAYTRGTPSGTSTSIAYVYGSSTWKDKMTKYNGQTITTDAIGNVTYYSGWSFGWEGGRQLKSMSKTGTSVSFAYNNDGIRTKKTVNGVVTNYNVVDGTIRSLTKGSDTVQFSYNDDSVVSMIYNGTEYWYVRNAQNDVIGLIDSSGAMVVSYAYDSWGKQLSVTGTLSATVGTINPFRYRGYVYDDETGLYYLQSRYYNPEWGRFINADSQLNQDEGLTGFNVFQYCGSNPVNRTDTSGQAWYHWAIGAAIVAACAVAVVITAGGAAAAIGAVAAVAAGGFAATTASTVAAAAFIGAATMLGTAAYMAASTSKTTKDFNSQGNWGTVAATAAGAAAGGIGGYYSSRNSRTSTTAASSSKSKGSTGRITPISLKEKLAMEEVRSNPLAGTSQLSTIMKDPRWSAGEGWTKMSRNVNGVEIHFLYNQSLKLFDDFKFGG